MLICCTGAAYSQVKFNYGIKGGFNISTYSYDPDDAQLRLGQWGALCRLTFLNGSMAVQPEIIYSRQGSRSLDLLRIKHSKPEWETTTNKWFDEVFKVKITTQYVQMPIMVKYYIPKMMGINVPGKTTRLRSARTSKVSVEVSAREEERRSSINFSSSVML